MRPILYLCGLILAVAFGYALKPEKQAPAPSCPPIEAANNASEPSVAIAPASPTQTETAAAAPEPPEPPKAAANVNDERPSADTSEDMSARLERIAGAFASSSDFTAISAGDLSVQTHKWDMKILQVELNCFYADVGDFRCTGPRSRVDFTALYPDSERKMIERDCDTIDKSQTKKCRRTLRFTYEGFEEMDVGGFLGKLTVARAGLNLGVIMPARDQPKVKRGSR
ncbi:hypothetical protein [Methylocystis sp. S23]